MKKLLPILLFVPFLLMGCSKEIPQDIGTDWKSEEWFSAADEFNKQIEESKILSDFSNLFSITTNNLNTDESIISSISLTGTFDKSSSVQGNIAFSKETKQLANKEENSEITFDINSTPTTWNQQPLSTQWSLSLLYRDKWLYAQLHDFSLYMWEWNTTAHMYSLFADLLIDRRIDLEAWEWWIINVDENNITASELVYWIKSIFKSSNLTPEECNETSKNIENLLQTINSYIKLWFEPTWLTLMSKWDWIYSEFSDWTIQKSYSGLVSNSESSFIFSYVASTKWIEISIWNITLEEPLDYEIYISLTPNKSDYNIIIKSIKSGQEVSHIEWNLKFEDTLTFQWNVLLEPLELIQWEKISGNIKWEISNIKSNNTVLPELSWNLLLLSNVLKSI